jgi:hypothetical protein
MSCLACFLTNPSPAYQIAIDWVLGYLKHMSRLALQLGGSKSFMVYSDTSYADDLTDYKSSQAYVMKLFGGLIRWHANKQETIIISMTEAELLALTQAAKEGLYISQLLKELTVNLIDNYTQIYCNNT